MIIMKTYLIWYVIQPIITEAKVANDLMCELWMWWMGMGQKQSPIFKSNKIKVNNINLPSIYKYLSQKNKVNATTITILWISLINN